MGLSGGSMPWFYSTLENNNYNNNNETQAEKNPKTLS